MQCFAAVAWGPPPQGSCCSKIADTEMIDFNPYWIYYLGLIVKGVGTVMPKERLAEHQETLTLAAVALEKFVADEQHKLFPESCEAATVLASRLKEVIALDNSKLLEFDDLRPMFTAIGGFNDVIQRESRRVYIVGLEKQRALDTSTLVESIETAYSPSSWKRFSKVTKREIEEAGRCLAFERYTASGFHFLRATENEIRDYIFLLTHAAPHKRDWGTYIQVLTTNGANPKLISLLDAIRTLDRNPLMHPEDWLSKDDAIGIFNTTQTALERLTADMEKKGLLPPI